MIKLNFDDGVLHQRFQNRPLYDGAITSIRNEIDKINQKDCHYLEFYREFRGLFPGFYKFRSECNISILTADEIKIYEDKIADNIRNILDECLELINTIIKLYPDNYGVINVQRQLSDKISSERNVENPDYSWIKDAKETIKRLLRELQNDDSRDGNEELVEKLQELLEKFKMIRVNFVLLGIYIPVHYEKINSCGHEIRNRVNDTIMICLDNISRININSNNQDFFNNLVSSILVHEYAHCVHHHYMKQKIGNLNLDNKIKRAAVLETIAETIQKLYICSMINGDDKWINKHISEEEFPGWGYAGENILYEHSSELHKHNDPKIYESKLLGLLIKKTEYNWKDAYSCLTAMNDLTELSRRSH